MADGLNLVEGDPDEEPVEVSMARIARSSERLADRLAPVENRSKWQTIGLVLVLVVALVAGVVGLENRRLTRSTEELTAQIKDCIDPTGECYRESRSRTGEVERRILADQAARSAEELEAVCDLFDGHGMTRPVQCGPDRPDAG
jgi:hypothetical protein